MEKKRTDVKLCFSFLYISMVGPEVMLALRSAIIFSTPKGGFHVLETSNSFTGTSRL